jgi:hypothetical protein
MEAPPPTEEEARVAERVEAQEVAVEVLVVAAVPAVVDLAAAMAADSLPRRGPRTTRASQVSFTTP